MRWLLLKDLQILRRSPLLVGLLIIYPIAISLLIGFVFMFIWQAVAPAYFRGETLPKRDSSDLILVGGGDLPTGFRLPDSAESTVIAPDLSNLPPGQTAIDPRTGERYVKGADEDGPPA